MTLLLSDPRVAAVPVHDVGEPLVAAPIGGPAAGPARLVRHEVAVRLGEAEATLPAGYHLHLVEGYRAPSAQQRIITTYAAELRALHPDADAAEIARLGSRYVAPLAVAPHVAGAAVDLTLVDASGAEVWMGCALDATPEQSGGACYLDARGLDPEARHHRALLTAALRGAGFVNYPTEWWHWSFGDRYWALTVGAPAAHYGRIDLEAAA